MLFRILISGILGLDAILGFIGYVSAILSKDSESRKMNLITALFCTANFIAILFGIMIKP